MNLSGEEAREQNLDWMNTLAPHASAGENCVERHRVRDELAQDSKVPKGSKQPYVNAARIRGRLSYLIWEGLSLSGGLKSAEAIGVGGVAATQGDQGNLATGRRAKRMSR